MPFIAQISDLHVGSINFVEELLVNAIDDLNDIHPDVTIITGDITDNGYFLEFQKAVTYLDEIKSPILVVPGNHDARHVGDECFEELIKNRYGILKDKKHGLKVIGLDSSEPDLDYGRVGRSQQNWMAHELRNADKENLYKIIALHHHIIPVPKTGRERNVLSDAGDILQTLMTEKADLVLSGHKHMPHVWIMENSTFITAGTVSSLRLRGRELSSFNTISIEEEFIEIILNRADGTQRCLAKYENTCLGD
jgi:3',5'-cyclic AMP phosphodiesterase CpdA